MITIKEPYWSAWQKYGWPKGTWGIGIDKKKVDAAGEEELILKIGKFPLKYRIKANKIREYAELNKTMFRAKGTLLYEIPVTELEVIL